MDAFRDDEFIAGTDSILVILSSSGLPAVIRMLAAEKGQNSLPKRDSFTGGPGAYALFGGSRFGGKRRLQRGIGLLYVDFDNVAEAAQFLDLAVCAYVKSLKQERRF